MNQKQVYMTQKRKNQLYRETVIDCERKYGNNFTNSQFEAVYEENKEFMINNIKMENKFTIDDIFQIDHIHDRKFAKLVYNYSNFYPINCKKCNTNSVRIKDRIETDSENFKWILREIFCIKCNNILFETNLESHSILVHTNNLDDYSFPPNY